MVLRGGKFFSLNDLEISLTGYCKDGAFISTSPSAQ